MSKSYEQLAKEASEEEFENLAAQLSEDSKELVRKHNKTKRLGETRRYNFHTQLPTSSKKLSDRGELQYIITDSIYDEAYQAQEEILNVFEHSMWAKAATDFGNKFTFIGNPFERAISAQREILKCVTEAQELFVTSKLGSKEYTNVNPDIENLV